MTELVTRHRGGGRDENGKVIKPVTSVSVLALEVAPGNTLAGSHGTVERARDGETIACTVYFPPGTDIVNGDELTVRKERYAIIVNDWRSGGRGGLEVLCTRGQG